jgi:LPXTG-motif cell wall-anchored protein
MTNGGKHRAAAEITVTQPAVPEEDEKDTAQTESNNDSNYDNNDQGTKTEDTRGNALPETATANYQFLLWGTLILVSGGILLVIYKRKSTINE